MGRLKGKRREFSTEHRRKISEALRGNQNSCGPRSEETRRKISEGHKGLQPWNKSKTLSLEHRKKMSESHLGISFSDEHRKKISESNKGHQGWWEGKSFSSEHRKKISQSLMGKPLSEEHRAKFISAGHRANNGSPSKQEHCLKETLDTLDPGWVHNSAQEKPTWISGKEPDFIRDHKIIELFGEYWHNETDELERKRIFGQVGYDCLVVWCRELGDIETLSRKILEFVGGTNEV